MGQQRYQAVLAVISDGLPISQVASKVGVSRQTLHSWLARYEAEGLEGLGGPVASSGELSASNVGRCRGEALGRVRRGGHVGMVRRVKEQSGTPLAIDLYSRRPPALNRLK